MFVINRLQISVLESPTKKVPNSRAISMAIQGDKYAAECLAWRSKGNVRMSEKCKEAAMKCWNIIKEKYPYSEIVTGININIEELNKLLVNTPWDRIRADRNKKWANAAMGFAAGFAFVSFFDRF